ncbi:MAG: hypothetical protein ABIG20_02470 [archaeon]
MALAESSAESTLARTVATWDPRMSSVIVVYDIIPNAEQATPEQIVEKLPGINFEGKGTDSKGKEQEYYFKLGETKVEDFVFGLKKVVATFEIPDAEGALDAFQEKLEGIEGVENVNLVNMGRPI